MKVVARVVVALLVAIAAGVAVEAVIWKAPTIGSVNGTFEVVGGVAPGLHAGIPGTVYLYPVLTCQDRRVPGVCNPYRGQPLAVAKSNRDGRFSITAPPGTYDLAARQQVGGELFPAPGYESVVTVIADAIVHRNIVLGVP